MLETFSTRAVQLIDEAKKIAQEEKEEKGEKLKVGTFYLLISMAKAKDTICHFLLDEQNISCEKLYDKYKELSDMEEAQNIFTTEFEEVVLKATDVSEKVNCEYVYDEHLFYALLQLDNTAVKVLKSLNININNLMDDIEDIFNFYGKSAIIIPKEEKSNKLNCLINLSTSKKVHPYIPRNNYIKRIIYILSKRQKNNPLIIGSAGVGKTALVEGLTTKISKEIYQLDLGVLVAGTKYRGEMEEKIIQAVKFVEQKKAILFIDEIHNIVGMGSNEGSLDLANLLKPYLTKGNIQIIAATTLDEYYKYIESDHALSRRFQKIFIDEPLKSDTINILKGIKGTYESYYKTEISNELITYIVENTDLFLPLKKFPDKAIDVLDETLSRYKITGEDKQKIAKDVIFDMGGLFVLTTEELKKIELNYNELKPFYLRMNYPMQSLNNLGVIRVDDNFNIDLLISDLSKVFSLKKEMVLTLDLEDYQNRESIQDLIGSSKGYVGYEQGGILYNHLLKYPFCLIYLKNMKNASAYVRSFFKNLFKKQMVIDSHSRLITLKNTMFIVNDVKEENNVGFIDTKRNNTYEYEINTLENKMDEELCKKLIQQNIIIKGFEKLTYEKQINLFFKAIIIGEGTYDIKQQNSRLELIKVK